MNSVPKKCSLCWGYLHYPQLCNWCYYEQRIDNSINSTNNTTLSVSSGHNKKEAIQRLIKTLKKMQ